MAKIYGISMMTLFKLAMLTSFVLAELFYASNITGFALTTLVIITLLTMSYCIRDLRDIVGIEPAY